MQRRPHFSSSRLRPARLACLLHAALATPLFLAPLALTTAAHAQISTQEGAGHYDIAPGPLGTVLSRFAGTANVVLSFDAALTAGKSSPGLQGSYRIEEGFARLLAGTGLEAAPQEDGGFILQVRRAGNDVTLAPVNVTAQHALPIMTEGTGSYTTRASNSATRMNLSLRETPQSISIITRQQMDDQGLTNIAEVLQQTPGVTIRRDNTEGYSFYARGFQIENFQFDGVPSLSTAGGNVRDNYSLTDSAIYDRVEVLKGATGLVNGAGYPSGVINLVRKRPTAEFQGHASVGAGSWDNYSGEVDLSGPLNTAGSLRGRVVAAVQDSRSFIDHLKTRQELAYGIFEADLAASTTLSMGFNMQKNKGDATTNAHLPAFYSDGTVARLSRSTNAADKWAYRNQDTQHLFATLEHDFGNNWTLKAHLGQRKYESRELIAGMNSSTIDVNTHSIAHGYLPGTAARFDTDTTEDNLDVQLSGQYSLLGREHKVVMGYSASRTKADSNRRDGTTDALIQNVFEWDNNATEPTAYQLWWTPHIEARQKIASVATVLHPTDRLSLIIGGRVTDYSWNLDSIFANGSRSNFSTKVNKEVTPYAGITFDLDDRHTVYASYTDIFKPQAYNYDANDRQLDPLTGESYEIGVKGSYYGGRLNASAALFRLEQDNYAINDPTGATRPGGGVAYIAAQGVTTKGAELELSGELRPGWQVSAGLAYVQPRDADGQRVSTTQPERTVKLATMYRLPGAWQHVRLGGNLQWQSATYFTQTIAGAPRRFQQDAYMLAGLVAGIDLTHNAKLNVTINNLFDKKYYAGIGNYNTVYWGTPRNVMATLRYDF